MHRTRKVIPSLCRLASGASHSPFNAAACDNLPALFPSYDVAKLWTCPSRSTNAPNYLPIAAFSSLIAPQTLSQDPLGFPVAPATATASPPLTQQLGFIAGGHSLSDFPPERVRNFSIIAHIDHGKSTLADRLLELTGAVSPGARQYLDKLQVEKERGITVKAQTASLVYNRPSDGQSYLLNLVDTPGHVDFSYEVSRSLAACQGCLLLVDASQGVQAQTVANFFLAFEQDLAIVPVLNKIDMPAAEPDRVAQQLGEAFDIPPEETNLRVSAKTGKGLEAVLEAVVERIPPPKGNVDGPPRLLLFDAYHDEFR